jgi:indolepyruvate ferredoxin oxidoreductase
LFSKRDPVTGELRKRNTGRGSFYCVPAAPRGSAVLRGSAFDIFGYTQERRAERQLIGDYERLIYEIVETALTGNHALAVSCRDP